MSWKVNNVVLLSVQSSASSHLGLNGAHAPPSAMEVYKVVQDPFFKMLGSANNVHLRMRSDYVTLIHVKRIATPLLARGQSVPHRVDLECESGNLKQTLRLAAPLLLQRSVICCLVRMTVWSLLGPAGQNAQDAITVLFTRSIAHA